MRCCFNRRSLSILTLLTVCSLVPQTVRSYDMVVVPAGIFVMGDGNTFSRCGEVERAVTLTNNFYLGQYEVTNQEYCDALQWAYDESHVTFTSDIVLDNLDGSSVFLVFLGEANCEISFSGGTFTVDPGREDHPMIYVSWYGAAAYCDWLSMQAGYTRAYDHSDWSCNGGDPYGASGYRLPTDAEWEYAAQYDDERNYPWGAEQPNSSLANFENNVGWTSPVGSYPAAPAALGLYDMAGNVWEWCNDYLTCDLGTVPATDPTGPGSNEFRVRRGGSWPTSWHCMRCAYRYSDRDLAASMNYDGGFRCARTHSPGTPTENASWGEIKRMFR